MDKKAVIILSGGLDSTTILHLANSQGYDLYALTFDYGQRHKIEIEHAKAVAQGIAKKHIIYKFDLNIFGGSSLTSDEKMSYFESEDQIENKIYNSYVPSRNTIFLSLALSYAETIGANNIFAGPNKDDYNNYPDCRPDFYKKFEELAILGTKIGAEGGKINILTPLINMTKPEIIKLGLSLGVDYGKTFSCYDPSIEGKACGKCLSCTIRISSFTKANLCDPINYIDRK
jgi:7-cyano-7-deazaguanine synthase